MDFVPEQKNQIKNANNLGSSIIMDRFLFLLLIYIQSSTYADEVEDFDGECGLGKKVSGYQFDFAGHKFYMPKQGLLFRSGKEIYRYKSTHDWVTNYSGLGLAETEEFLVIRVWNTD